MRSSWIRWGSLCAGVLGLLAGCGKSVEPAVAAADYARACTDVADCVAIYEGPLVCCVDDCPNAAIRQDALSKYQDDVVARTPKCNSICGGSCQNGRVACRNGRCELDTPAGDGATGE